ncbi:hypothetical protein [Streptomyces albidoflavus]|uniref:hypothetical protein n=1 Tax=Streptomyces albidoflavus TaxID=1886 RepID=UPI0030879614|nr:hypothetical protein OG919_24145 [Streptomyces albidoflavus]
MESGHWKLLADEAGLASYCLGSGLASMRKANIVEPKHYYGAFFEYTIGLERVLKLALIVDYCVEQGRFPSDQKYAKKFGHELSSLIVNLSEVRGRLNPAARVWEIPDGPIFDAAVTILSDFARVTRYYNIDVLTGKEPTADPVARWFLGVGIPLMRTRKKNPDVQWARLVDDAAGDAVSIRFTDLGGNPVSSFEDMARITKDSEFIARESTFLCAKLARYAISVFVARAEQASQSMGLPYFEEFFYPLLLEDSALKKRKTFML